VLERVRAAPTMDGLDLVPRVTCGQRYEWDKPTWRATDDGRAVAVPPAEFHVVAYDFGIKENILRQLRDIGARVTVVPATTPAKDALALGAHGFFLSNGPGDPATVAYGIAATKELMASGKPVFGICLGHQILGLALGAHGFFLSNGPGDPATVAYGIAATKELMASGKPVFGICLGHQILGLALGGRTSKLSFGHHGGNHPVLDKTTGRVEITSQNHGFVVDVESLPSGVHVTHENLFDHSNEGIAVAGKPIFSVQYHPEASPGPHDASYLFARFREALKRAT
jgi:carbamoyl-phosphate synthase small subunit